MSVETKIWPKIGVHTSIKEGLAKVHWDKNLPEYEWIDQRTKRVLERIIETAAEEIAKMRALR